MKPKKLPKGVEQETAFLTHEREMSVSADSRVKALMARRKLRVRMKIMGSLVIEGQSMEPGYDLDDLLDSIEEALKRARETHNSLIEGWK
jgi:hypothetical protein